jgi:hypothetical protein
MEITDTHIVIISSIVVILVLVGMVAASSNEDTAEFDVTVAQQTWLDINPNSTSWTSVDPGTTTSAADFSLYNIGSNSIASIKANNTMPSSWPFGTDTATNFDAGNFITIKNTTDTKFYYINRKEFNETAPAYVTLPSAESGTTTFGKIRIGDEEIFWAAAPNVTCDAAGAKLYLGTFPHTKTDTGDIDLSDNSVSLSSGAADITLQGITDSNFGTSYCAIVSSDCTELTLARYNVDVDTNTVCSNDVNLYSGDLNPGSTIDIQIRAYVPYGVADGSVTTGTIYVIAS